jgi:hypothetical protein
MPGLGHMTSELEFKVVGDWLRERFESVASGRKEDGETCASRYPCSAASLSALPRPTETRPYRHYEISMVGGRLGYLRGQVRWRRIRGRVEARWDRNHLRYG